MKKSLTFVLLLLSAAAYAEEPVPQCNINAVDSAKLKAITDKYTGTFAALRDEAAKGAKKIQDDSPDGGAETALGIDGHVETRRVDFSFDIPEVSIKDQKFSIDIPEISMKTQTWSYDTIRTTTYQDCRAGPDEIVVEWKTCHNGFPPFDYPCPETRTRPGSDICLPAIKMEPYREEIKLDIPETKMSRQDWVLGVPEFKMTTQKFAFDYPVLIVDDINVKTEEQKKAAQDLSKRTSEAGQRISDAMKSEIRSASFGPIEQAFNCQKTQLQKNTRQAFDKLTQINAATAAGYQKAKEINSAEAIASYEKALNGMKEGKTKMLQNYAKLRRDLAKKKREALTKL